MDFVTGCTFVSEKRHFFKKHSLLGITVPSAAICCSPWQLLGFLLTTELPWTCYGEIMTTSGQRQKNQWGPEGWTSFVHSISMNIFRLKELTVQKSNSLIFPKGKYKQVAPLKKVFLLVFQHSLLFMLNRYSSRDEKTPSFAYCGLYGGQRAFFCRKSWQAIESYLPKLISMSSHVWGASSGFCYAFPHQQRAAVTGHCPRKMRVAPESN